MLASCLLTLLLSACGGAGGSPTVLPKVSVSGPLTVWSDDHNWTAVATATGMDPKTVGYTISGGDENIEIDAITGAINSTGDSVISGFHRFSITATDGTGLTASTTYDLRSDAFIAGIWLSNDTDYEKYFELLVTRSGEIFTTSSNDYNDDLEQCSGIFTITGSDLDGEIHCNRYLADIDSNYSADIEATVHGREITINEMTIMTGELTGLVDDDPKTFYQVHNKAINISPGIYLGFAGFYEYMELQVSADGSFNTLTQEEAIVNYSDISACQVNGNITADPIYGLPTVSGDYHPIDVHHSTFTSASCSADYEQSMVPAVTFAVLSPTDHSTPHLYFGTSGSPDSNAGYNASNRSFIQACDEFKQPTAFANYLGMSCTVSQRSAHSGNLPKGREKFDAWIRGDKK